MNELLTIQESAIKVSSRFTYTVLHSSLDQIRLAFPEAATVLNVAGPSLQNWKTDSKKGGKILTVFFNRKVKGTQTLTIRAEFPLNQASEMALPLFRTASAQREEGHIGIEAKSNVQVSLKEAKNLRRVDVKELPRSLWNQATSPLLFGFSFTKPEGTLSLEIERHETIPVLSSTIDSANAVTVLTKDGQWITRVSFQVRNHLKQFLELSLPETAEIWSALSAANPSNPPSAKTAA